MGKKKNRNACLRDVLDDQQQEYLRRYVHQAAQLLQLSDWTIRVTLDKAAADGAHATNANEPDSTHCEIRFSARFHTLEPSQQRQIIAHELMHCHLFALADRASACFSAVADQATVRVFNTSLNSDVEQVTDKLADIATAMLPEFCLPPRLTAVA